MENTKSTMAKSKTPLYKKIKIDNSKIWALWGQVIFALFVVIAFYAISFEAYKSNDLTNKALSKHFLSDFGANSDVFGLGVTGLVFVFVGIVMPAVSFFYKNDKVNFFLGWGTVLFDVIAFATVTASIGMFASWNNATRNLSTIKKDSIGVIYDDGYLAGQFIFEMLGAIIAGLGIYSSYKEDLVNKETVKWIAKGFTKKEGTKKAPKNAKASKDVKAKANGKEDDVVIIGDEDNKSFKTQEKEINKVNKKEEKETKKDAEAVFGKPSKESKPSESTKTVDAVIIGDEDNKSFKTQEKEINKVEKKQEKETVKDAKKAFSAEDKKAAKKAAKREKESEKKLAAQKKTIL